MPTAPITTSARGVILAGQSFVDVNICLPKCPRRTEFLVQSVHVGPEVIIGATAVDIVNLRNWAISVPVYQRVPGAEIQVALTALGQGAEHISASLPAGQSVGPLAGSAFIPVRIVILGGAVASHRFEFNIHLTGVCGNAFTCPQAAPKKRSATRAVKQERRKGAR
jgi:hypothetical protein